MKIAIAFVVCDRPEYFKEVLKSVKEQTLSFDNFDVYLFQDGSKNKSKVEESIALFKEHFPEGKVRLQPSNVGVALNYHVASKVLFEDYSHIIFFEEDMIISPYYLESLIPMIEKFGDDERVGMISCSGEHMLNDLETQKKFKNDLIFMERTWGFCLPKHAFLKIQPRVEEYLNKFIVGKDYRKRDSVGIRKWYEEIGFNTISTSQDTVKLCSLAEKSLIKITCFPGMIKHIGIEGLHNNHVAYDKYRFGEQVLFNEKIDNIEDLTEEKYNAILKISNKLIYRMKPWMTDNELALLVRHLKPTDYMLEWGSGGSTIYFSSLVKEYFSIEHNKEWFDKVDKELTRLNVQNVNYNLVLPEFEHFGLEAAKPKQFIRYNNFPDSFNTCFDKILVDGRDRANCAVVAAKLLKPGGILFFHDFVPDRTSRYREVFKHFKIVDQVEKLAIMKLK